jgi:hemolysin III
VERHQAGSRPPSILVADGDRAHRATYPAWRGVSHEKAFALAPALAVLLVASAEGLRAQTAAVLFATTMTVMLGVSTMNHRMSFAPRWRPWLRRADHSAINVFLAGTWTAIALVALSGTARVALTALVWGAALAASLVTIVWVDVSGWIPATIAVGVGWSTGVVFSDAAWAVSIWGVALFLLGGVFYTCGAVVYALRHPEPHLAFGYHELFHLLVLAGVACHYLALEYFVLPLAK